MIENKQEHYGHHVHHGLHTGHLIASAGVVAVYFGVNQVGDGHQQTKQADVVTKEFADERNIGLPANDGVVSGQVLGPEETFLP